MNLPDYEYKGLMAQAWDVLRGDTSQWPDRFFYLDIIHRFGQPVLDVGCGTGRLLLDYLQQGIEIDGIDNSPEMLSICRQKAEKLGLSPTLFDQYLENLSISRKYKVILIPSSSLQLIIKQDLVVTALRNLYNILQPGGVLVASIMTLWKPDEPLYTEWEKEAADPSNGWLYKRIAKSWYDPETECERTEDAYQLWIDDQMVKEEFHSRSPATRSYTQNQAKLLFESAGFCHINLFHEFTFDPVKSTDILFTVVAHR